MTDVTPAEFPWLASDLLEDEGVNASMSLRSPMKIGDCARTVHESNVFIAWGLAVSEKQIPQIVENIGNQNSGWS